MIPHRAWLSRPWADNLLLLAVACCVVIAVVRIAFVVTAVPEALGSATPAETFLHRLERSGAWASWWAGREIPVREGGDYLRIMSRTTSPTRTVGSVIGVLVERDRARGITIDRVLVPTNEEALFGRPPGALFTRPDGTTYRSLWAPVASYARYFTDVPVEPSAYDPFLTAAGFADLAARTRLTQRSRDFFTADPALGGSGTWVLLSRQGAQREYLLVPLELTRIGSAS